jgi:hypothetical protein
LDQCNFKGDGADWSADLVLADLYRPLLGACWQRRRALPVALDPTRSLTPAGFIGLDQNTFAAWLGTNALLRS